MDMGLAPIALTNTAHSDIDTAGYAVFGQATYTFFDKLNLTGGLHYEYEKNEMDYSSDNISGGQILLDMSMNFDGSKHDDVLLPKAQIGYHWTPDFMTYAGITRGYRSSGFNTTFLSMEDMSFGPTYS